MRSDHGLPTPRPFARKPPARPTRFAVTVSAFAAILSAPALAHADDQPATAAQQTPAPAAVAPSPAAPVTTAEVREKYRRILETRPGTREASEAALILEALDRAAFTLAPPLAVAPVPNAPASGNRRPPPLYSRVTQEKADPGALDYAEHFINIFGIGAGTGALYAAAGDGNGTAYALTITGFSLTYSIPSIVLAATGGFDRGDMPFISLLSSAPVYATLFPAVIWVKSNSAYGGYYYDYSYERPRSSPQLPLLLPAILGTVGFVAGHVVASEFRFDPGDMEFLREMVFLGGLYGAGTAGLISLSSYSAPEGDESLAVGVPLGMALGLTAGLLGAQFADVSFERTYFSMLALYGGAAVGASLMIPVSNGSAVIGSAMGVGALSFALTFGLTSFLDRVPDDAIFVEDFDNPKTSFLKSTKWFQPTTLSYTDENGRPQPGFGLKIAEGRW